MGNRICRNRRSMVEERLTKPQRLVVQPPDIDYKSLRKLIRSRKLAPCFEAVEDFNPDLEECPICFFFYPSLNRSKCCTKGICTDEASKLSASCSLLSILIFRQLFASSLMSWAATLMFCPFCKFSNYAVEYNGAKTQEEKNLEQAEEQKVIEAKIRMQLLESQNVVLQQIASSDELESPPSCSVERSCGDVIEGRDLDLNLITERIEEAELPERDEEFSLDLEEIMLTEAIWQSLQDSCSQKSTDARSVGHSGVQDTCRESDRIESSSSSHGVGRVLLADSGTGERAFTSGEW